MKKNTFLLPHVPYPSWQYCEYCHRVSHLEHTFVLIFLLASLPQMQVSFRFFCLLVFSHQSWGRSWLPYILHYLAREGAVLEKDRTWSKPKVIRVASGWGDQSRLGVCLAFQFEWRWNFQSFLCCDYAIFWTQDTPKSCQRCRILPEGCGKMLSFGGKLWQGWVFWRLFDRLSFFFIVFGVVGFFLRTILSWYSWLYSTPLT